MPEWMVFHWFLVMIAGCLLCYLMVLSDYKYIRNAAIIVFFATALWAAYALFAQQNASRNDSQDEQPTATSHLVKIPSKKDGFLLGMRMIVI